MESFMNNGMVKSKNARIVSSLFQVLLIQLSIVVVGLSYSASPFSLLPFIQNANGQVDQLFKTYENPKFGLTLSYPPTWSVDELRKDPTTPSNNSIVAIFKSPAQGNNDRYLENVIVNVQGPRSDIKSLETYTQNSLKAFNNMSDTIKITKSGTDTLGGLPAHLLEYTSKGIQGLNLKKMQVFTVVNNNTAYVVTYGAEEPEYQKNLQDVEKLINSAKIDRNAMNNVEEKQSQPTKTSSNPHTVLIDGKYNSGT
jgi:eukaryotic-like serine/threonine-protein kinase